MGTDRRTRISYSFRHLLRSRSHTRLEYTFQLSKDDRFPRFSEVEDSSRPRLELAVWSSRFDGVDNNSD